MRSKVKKSRTTNYYKNGKKNEKLEKYNIENKMAAKKTKNTDEKQYYNNLQNETDWGQWIEIIATSLLQLQLTPLN